jgi:septum formation protein
MKSIVLASSSPRRKKLLERIGIPFIVDPSTFNESSISLQNPNELVQALALEKARDVAKRHKNSIIIGVDTIVVYKNTQFGKPKNIAEAKQMLKTLSGNTHEVTTGIALVDSQSNKELTNFQTATVEFNNLTDKEIYEYLETGKAMDKAGAYAIQEGKSKYFIKRTQGDYTTIVGLPLKLLTTMLLEFGIYL